MNEILLAGSYELPLSINETYFTDDAGRRRLTFDAREYKENLKERLDIGQALPPYSLYLNIPVIQQAREIAFLAKQKKKKFLGDTWYYKLDCLYVFANNRRDLDNGNKLFQDAIFEWLGTEDKLITDKFMIDIHIKGCVDKLGHPHIEFVLRHIDVACYPGMLLEAAARERNLDTQYTAWWDETTQKNEAVDV